MPLEESGEKTYYNWWVRLDRMKDSGSSEMTFKIRIS